MRTFDRKNICSNVFFFSGKNHDGKNTKQAPSTLTYFFFFVKIPGESTIYRNMSLNETNHQIQIPSAGRFCCRVHDACLVLLATHCCHLCINNTSSASRKSPTTLSLISSHSHRVVTSLLCDFFVYCRLMQRQLVVLDNFIVVTGVIVIVVRVVAVDMLMSLLLLLVICCQCHFRC